jgi:enoyl-CoA hydratase/carnithine racemase
VTVRVETVGPARVITIDRPDAKNAIDRAHAEALRAAIDAADADPTVRGVVLCASGDVFLSGGDLKEFAPLSRSADGAGEILRFAEDFAATIRCDVPVVAAVQGDAIGGGSELLLLCDLVVMEEQARMVFRHAKMGLTPAWGAVAQLLSRLGPMRTAHALYTAAPIDAHTARDWGLANLVVSTGGAREAALGLVDELGASSRESVAALKRVLWDVRAALSAPAPAIEQAAFAARWGGPDHLAAMQRFERRR